MAAQTRPQTHQPQNLDQIIARRADVLRRAGQPMPVAARDRAKSAAFRPRGVGAKVRAWDPPIPSVALPGAQFSRKLVPHTTIRGPVRVYTA